MRNDSKEARKILAIALAPNRQVLAVSEAKNRCCVQSECSRHRGLQYVKASTVIKSDSNSSQQSGHCQVATYNVDSGSCQHAVRMSVSTVSTALAFGPDSKCLAIVGEKQCEAARSRQQHVILWEIDKARTESSGAITNGSASNVWLHYVNERLCAVTAGFQHLRIWFIAENSICTSSLLSATCERAENFVAHSGVFAHQVLASSDLLHAAVLEPPTSLRRCNLLVLSNFNVMKGTGTTGSAQNRTSFVRFFEATTEHPHLCRRYTAEVEHDGQIPLAISAYVSGFCVAGTCGFFALFTYQDVDTIDQCTLVRSFCISLGSGAQYIPTWTSIAASSSGDAVVGRTCDGMLFVFPLQGRESEYFDSEDSRKQFVFPITRGVTFPLTSIEDLSVCSQQSLVVTRADDGALRMWSMSRQRCELLHDDRTWANEHPLCLTLHPLGVQLAVGFKEVVRFYSVLFKSLKLLREIPASRCHALCYAHGGHQAAFSVGGSVIFISAISLSPVFGVNGHSAPPASIRWTDDDLALFTLGIDGSICGWDLSSRTQMEDEQEIQVASGPAQGLAVRSQREGHFDLTSDKTICYQVACVDTDGCVQESRWKARAHSSLTHAKGEKRRSLAKSESSLVITVIAATSDWPVLFVGTSIGSIRTYTWNTHVLTDECGEVHAHDGAVVCICLQSGTQRLFSAGIDGIVFVFSLRSKEESLISREQCDAALWDTSDLTPIECCYPLTSSLVQVSIDDLEESEKVLADMRRSLDMQKKQQDLTLHRRDLDWETELKHSQANKSRQLSVAHTRYELLEAKYQLEVTEHKHDLSCVDTRQMHAARETENKVSSRLAIELERYDTLNQEVANIQLRCDGLMRSQMREHESAIRNSENKTMRIELEMRQQIDRLHEDSKHNEQMFREVSHRRSSGVSCAL
mmetsp:Transcript_11375/g.34050  ORF Transcript_11375/g.34050 Transcript_11375/m.34050 type:complete len:918 (-) Transcript_11375:1362-4115(-)